MHDVRRCAPPRRGRRGSPRGSPPIAWFESLEARALMAGDAGAAAPGAAPPGAAMLVDAAAVVQRPRVTAVRPGVGAIDVQRDTSVAADLFLPNGGIATDSVTADTVRLVRTSDGAPVAASSINTSGGGDALVFQPAGRLEPKTAYTFVVTDGVRDLAGNPIEPFTSTFTTGIGPGAPDGPVRFDKIPQAASQWRQYTSLAKGPDGRLYAGTLDGEVLRFGILPDGSLDAPTIIDTLRQAHGGANRYLIGLTFDPASTADNPVLWVSHGPAAAVGAADWSSVVGRLSGANLEHYESAVVGLPRSYRDHLTNQLAFGPDGALYFAQASNSAMGAPDRTWGDRPEHLLTGAVLRLDTKALAQRRAAGRGALDVRTPDGGGAYDPYAVGAPLTIYATGVRNAYDLLWHSNGQLYAPVNGSAAGGNTPAAPGRPELALTGLQQTDSDYLLRVTRNGYYGHPNPARGQYVLDGGNPTDAVDPAEISAYPVGTYPDPDWRLPAYNFGANYSPDGIAEYTSGAFGGALKGALLVTRYSGGDDLVVLRADAAGNIVSAQSGAPGMTGFNDPVDVIVDPSTGNVYVAEFGGRRIALLRPTSGPGGEVALPPPEPPRVGGLQVVDADTGATIAPLVDGATIDLAAVPSRRVTIRAEGAGGTQSVRFDLDGVGNYRTESHAPYSLCGDVATAAGVVYSAWSPSLGGHALKVYGFDGISGTGKRSDVYAVQFSVTDSSIVPPPVATPPEPATPGPTDPQPAEPSEPAEPAKPSKPGKKPNKPDKPRKPNKPRRPRHLPPSGTSWVPFLGPFRVDPAKASPG